MKQVIVVNESLKLPKGKLAAQVAHASIAAYTDAPEEARNAWLEDGMPKIVLQCADEEELNRLADLAQDRNIPAHLIKDAGRTVVAAGTVTCLGLGPAEDGELDSLTSNMKLLD
jgi:peptidyl-tRNA hydrolase|tara:strand:- start:3919 stop:4260 length:342 start_codon:yes stop_codon:yes gene_type:complete